LCFPGLFPEVFPELVSGRVHADLAIASGGCGQAVVMGAIIYTGRHTKQDPDILPGMLPLHRAFI